MRCAEGGEDVDAYCYHVLVLAQTSMCVAKECFSTMLTWNIKLRNGPQRACFGLPPRLKRRRFIQGSLGLRELAGEAPLRVLRLPRRADDGEPASFTLPNGTTACFQRWGRLILRHAGYPDDLFAWVVPMSRYRVRNILSYSGPFSKPSEVVPNKKVLL